MIEYFISCLESRSTAVDVVVIVKNYCLYTHSMELRFSLLISVMVAIRCGIFVSSILNAISLDN